MHSFTVQSAAPTSIGLRTIAHNTATARDAPNFRRAMRKIGVPTANSTDAEITAANAKRLHTAVRSNAGVEPHTTARRREAYDHRHASRRFAVACPSRATCYASRHS